MNRYYEHHIAIKKDKLCPFKLQRLSKISSPLCNWHVNIEILLITKGIGRIQYGKDTLPLEPHDIIIINSCALHRLQSTDDWEYYCLIIDESFCTENGLDTSAINFRKKLRDAETEKLYLEVVKRMSIYSEDTSALSVASLRSATLSLLIDLCEKHTEIDETPAGKNSPSEEYIKRVLDYLNATYAQPITLDELAQMCGITKHHLAREFRKYMGQTVFTYLNMIRCKNAEYCLSEGMSVTEAAYESGFESLSYFSRTYKELMGVTPRCAVRRNS